jgi:hypothetical protein
VVPVSDAVTWRDFAEAADELAACGRQRLEAGPSYLATTRASGFPRVHPVNSKVHAGHLALYTFPTSPKRADLRRDPRFALHASVEDVHGGGGEFAIRGLARFVEDDGSLGAELAAAGMPPLDGYVSVELLVVGALAGTYDDTGSNVPRLQRWELGAH